MSERIPAGSVVDKLGIQIVSNEALPTAGILIVRSMYPTGEVGLTIGTSPTQSWVDNVGLIRAAEMIVQNDLLVHTITGLTDDDDE